MKKINEEIIKDILSQMPDNKKLQLENALNRNYLLTSSWLLEDVDLTVYKEGWLVELIGTRCVFRIWASDNDGEFELTRKPNESKLHKLYTDYGKSNFLDFNDYVI